MDIRDVDCEDKVWMAVIQNHIRSQALLLAALTFCILLPKYLLSEKSQGDLQNFFITKIRRFKNIMHLHLFHVYDPTKS